MISAGSLGRCVNQLKFQREQGGKFGFMAALGVLQTVDDGLFKGGERGVVAPMETLGFHKLPEPFNEIEIRGIGGQPEKVTPRRSASAMTKRLRW